MEGGAQTKEWGEKTCQGQFSYGAEDAGKRPRLSRQGQSIQDGMVMGFKGEAECGPLCDQRTTFSAGQH